MTGTAPSDWRVPDMELPKEPIDFDRLL